MSDLENQYNSPQAPVVPEKKQAVGSLTELMLVYLKQASPWLKFVGILGFISCGLMVLGSLSFLIVLIFASSLVGESGSFLPLWIFSPIYLATGAILFFPSLYEYRFGEKIRKFQITNSEEDLEEAFKNNKSLWKFYGILCLISIAATPVILIVSVIVGIAASNLF